MKKKSIFSILIVILILIFGSVYYFYFYEPELEEYQDTTKETSIDSRFLMVYGQISSLDDNLLKIEIKKNPLVTDYIFHDEDIFQINIGNDTFLKKYSLEKKDYNTLKTSDLKIGNFVSVYLKEEGTSYEIITLEVFEKDII